MPDMDEAIAARLAEALKPVQDSMREINETVLVLIEGMKHQVDLLEQIAKEMPGTVEPEPEPPVLPNPPVIGKPGLKEVVTPDGYRQRDMVYNNQFEELHLESGHGVELGDIQYTLALRDNWVTWGKSHDGLVTLDFNSDKCIKVHQLNKTHELTANGLALRTWKYKPEMIMSDWIKDSYGANHNATVGGMITTEGRVSTKVGVWQVMVRKNVIMPGDHASLWTLADTDPSPWPPEEDLFEQVPGDPMGDGLSINVHGTDSFERFPELTLEDWTLAQIEFTEDGQVVVSYNGEEMKRTENPFPDLARYLMFCFESNGNWPTNVGSATEYEDQGSEYEIAYIRLFDKAA